jgi:hypothetical protein
MQFSFDSLEPAPQVVEKAKANRNGSFPRKGKVERLFTAN